MDVSKAYALSTSSWLALESLPLLLTPKLIVSLAASEPRRITDLETYLCRSLGMALLTLALLCLLLTGTLPVATTTASTESDSDVPKKDPYALPTVVLMTSYHALTAFYLYGQLTYHWNFAFTAGLAGNSALFCFGVWVMMFGSEKASISKWGGDKRTSNFPFENRESAKEKKKEEKGKRRSMARTKNNT